MEAPTSSYTGSNLYNREHLFSLAPPCHPGFSGCNQMESTTPCVQAPTWTSEDNSPPEHLPTTLKYKSLLLKLVTVIRCSTKAYQTHHCSAAFRYSVCLIAFLHTSLALSVLLPFMLCAPYPFTAQILFCSIHLLHSPSSSHMNHLHQLQSQQTLTATTTSSLLCTMYL